MKRHRRAHAIATQLRQLAYASLRRGFLVAVLAIAFATPAWGKLPEGATPRETAELARRAVRGGAFGEAIPLLTQLIRIVRPDFDYGWLGVPSHAMFWVFITICWRYTGFHLVLFLAGISAIPTQLYEAARIDGAGEWSQARHITLPLLKPTLAVAATLSIIGSLKYFDLVYLMAAGVPEESRELLATYVYRLAFEGFSGRFGYGSAAAVSLLLVALAVVLPLQTRRRAATEEGA